MERRILAAVSAFAVAVVLGSLAVRVSGQTPSPAGKSAAPKPGLQRTAWGDPDLQGTWSYATLTPLERPAAMAGREFFTPEEASQRNADVELDAPPRPGDVGAYNALWFDRGKVASTLRTSLIVDPVDGRLPLTPEGRKLIAGRVDRRRVHPADSWLDRTPWDRCITYHGVPPVSTGYNNTYQILQTPGYVVIRVENIHDVRIIPLDGRARLPDGIRLWNGDSRGHFDGNTLVVETTNYSDKTELRFPSTRDTHAVERFTRVSADLIENQFTINDPTLYSKPWTAVRPMPRLPGYHIYEYACHEGNYAMTGILSGARAEEKASEEAKRTSSK